MRSLAFIASYPRSGNTFVRTLLANYEYGHLGCLSINEVAQYGGGEKNEAIWRAVTGVPAEQRQLDDYIKAMPQYYSIIRTTPGFGTLVTKTHMINMKVNGRLPFDLRSTDRVVYIVRHPMDVTLSYADYNDLDLDTMVDCMLRSGFYTNLPVGTFEVTGSWREHVTQWRDETRCPVLVVRYVDLVRQTSAQLTRIAEFIWGRADPARVAKAVECSSFERQKNEEARLGFEGALPSRRGAFFREGRPGQWRSAMPETLALRLESALGDLMDEFGFERYRTLETRAASRASSGR